MTRFTLTIIYLVVLSLAASALAQNDPKNKPTADKATSSLLLSADEVNSLENINKALQVQNQKESIASQVIIEAEADNLDAITLAAIKWRKIAIDGRKAIQSQYQSWLAKVQEAHKCPGCNVTSDGKSLVKPPEPAKPASDK